MEDVVNGEIVNWSGRAENIADTDSDGVVTQTQTMAVVAVERCMAVDGDIERVDEAVIFGHVLADDDGGFAPARVAVDFLVTDRKLFVGIALEVCAVDEIEHEADLEMRERTERGVVFGDDRVDESAGVACT